jgi:hypothetical protein
VPAAIRLTIAAAGPGGSGSTSQPLRAGNSPMAMAASANLLVAAPQRRSNGCGVTPACAR